MKIFLACPVRGITEDYREKVEKAVARMEQMGHQVHYPPRDTNQIDNTGLRICTDNRTAIEQADVVCVMWDGKSQGVLFDLGMAFALRKNVIPMLPFMPDFTEGKSFQNMLWDWYVTEDGVEL